MVFLISMYCFVVVAFLKINEVQETVLEIQIEQLDQQMEAGK